MVDAEDLTQDFFVRFLEGHLDAAADPARGHFRGLLLTALKRFLISSEIASHAKKRGGGLQRAEHDDELDRLPARESESPEQAFERAWALTVLEHAFTRLRAEAERAGQSNCSNSSSPMWASDLPVTSTRALRNSWGCEPTR